MLERSGILMAAFVVPPPLFQSNRFRFGRCLSIGVFSQYCKVRRRVIHHAFEHRGRRFGHIRCDSSGQQQEQLRSPIVKWTAHASQLLSEILPRRVFGFIPRSRFLSAAAFLAAIVGSAMAGGWYFALLIGSTQIIGMLEYFRLVHAKGHRPTVRSTMLATMLYAVTCEAAPHLAEAIIPITGTWILFYLMLQNKYPATISDLASSILGLFYVGYLPGFWIRLRRLDQEAFANLPLGGYWPSSFWAFRDAHSWSLGHAATFVTVLCVVATDIGGYVFGKQFGRTPFTKISPKKTVEGVIGGSVFSVFIAVAAAHFFKWPMPLLTGPLFGFLITISSVFGDLTESLMKRDAGVKDSGDWIPGHGGMLDRGDSYIFSGVLAYFFVTLVLPFVRSL
mmetsp:Transcript_5260/g.8140  ORF Transcript_5260/g.8140 Transcript_5260/m.8140 type:complete len:393 (-) Transcript_5260:643-1821(-)